MHRDEERRMRAAMRRGLIRDPLYYSCNPSESGAQKTDGGLLRREREKRERMVKGLGCTGVNTFLSCQLELAWQQRCDGFDGMIGTHRPGPMNDLDELHIRNFEAPCPDSMRRSCPSIGAKRDTAALCGVRDGGTEHGTCRISSRQLAKAKSFG